MRRTGLSVICVLTCLSFVNRASAQGLLLKLPEKVNGIAIYSGTYEQTNGDEQTKADLEKLEWKRSLEIKSLKKAKGFHDGKEVDCRWIEIKVSTGQLLEGDIDEGPIGMRIYKILVPEAKITDKPKDEENIFVSMIPIASDSNGKPMGMRKIGNTPAERIKSHVLQIYPLISFLGHYKNIKMVSKNEPPLTVSGKQLPRSKFEASKVMENRAYRSKNTAQIWTSSDSPFGLAGWEVELIREEKNKVEEREFYKKVSTIVIKMTLREIKEGDVQSELPDPS